MNNVLDGVTHRSFDTPQDVLCYCGGKDVITCSLKIRVCVMLCLTVTPPKLSSSQMFSKSIESKTSPCHKLSCPELSTKLVSQAARHLYPALTVKVFFSLDFVYLISPDRISGGYQEDILEQFEKSKMAAIVNRKLNH